MTAAPSLLSRLRARLFGPPPYRPAPPPAPVNLIGDGAGWALDVLGRYTAEGVNLLAPHTAAFHADARGLGPNVVHFTSRLMWLDKRWALEAGARTVVTFLHGHLGTEAQNIREELAAFQKDAGEIAHLVTSCSLIENRLTALGISPDKITVIPLGVDTRLFTPVNPPRKQVLRRQFGLPEEAMIVGSFQKDGDGWGEGLSPKLVKGPDLFVEAVARLARDFPIHVLLTGPARGYVKTELEKRNVPFTHLMRHAYEDTPDCYRALDLYIVASRDEGGPLALPESMASGIPIVSTPVGMAPDMIRHGENGFLSGEEDAAGLAARGADILADPDLAARLTANALEGVAPYDWHALAARHYREVYLPLLG